MQGHISVLICHNVNPKLNPMGKKSELTWIEYRAMIFPHLLNLYSSVSGFWFWIAPLVVGILPSVS